MIPLNPARVLVGPSSEQCFWKRRVWIRSRSGFLKKVRKPVWISPATRHSQQVIARVWRMRQMEKWEMLIVGSRVLTVQYLNLVMKLCWLSDKMRGKGNKITSQEGKWE